MDSGSGGEPDGGEMNHGFIAALEPAKPSHTYWCRRLAHPNLFCSVLIRCIGDVRSHQCVMTRCTGVANPRVDGVPFKGLIVNKLTERDSYEIDQNCRKCQRCSPADILNRRHCAVASQ